MDMFEVAFADVGLVSVFDILVSCSLLLMFSSVLFLFSFSPSSALAIFFIPACILFLATKSIFSLFFDLPPSAIPALTNSL